MRRSGIRKRKEKVDVKRRLFLYRLFYNCKWWNYSDNILLYTDKGFFIHGCVSFWERG